MDCGGLGQNAQVRGTDKRYKHSAAHFCVHKFPGDAPTQAEGRCGARQGMNLSCIPRRQRWPPRLTQGRRLFALLSTHIKGTEYYRNVGRILHSIFQQSNISRNLSSFYVLSFLLPFFTFSHSLGPEAFYECPAVQEHRSSPL